MTNLAELLEGQRVSKAWSWPCCYVPYIFVPSSPS